MTVPQSLALAAALPAGTTADQLVAVNALKPGPAPVFIDWTNLGWGERLGLSRAAAVRAVITGAAAAGDAMSGYLDAMMSGRGLNIADPQTAAVLPMLVGAGFLTQAEADVILGWGGWQSDARRILGRDATEDDVTEAVAMAARQAELMALEMRVDALRSWLINEKIRPAMADAQLPVPTWDQLVAKAQE